MQEDVKVEELEEEGQEIEIEDNKEQESNEVSVESKDKPENVDDLSEYSDSVKKRISKLTNRFREEERQRQAAVDYAEAVKKQNEELKTRIDKLDTTYVGEFDTRVQSQAIAAKEAYKKALEDGNADAMYDAQQNISRIAMEEARLAQLKAVREERTKEVQAQQPQAQAPQAQAPQAKPDPKAEGWAQDRKSVV
jgi:archaellum component FlaC